VIEVNYVPHGNMSEERTVRLRSGPRSGMAKTIAIDIPKHFQYLQTRRMNYKEGGSDHAYRNRTAIGQAGP